MRSDRWVWLLALAVAARAVTVDPPAFSFFQEFYGSAGYDDPQVKLNLQQGMMNGITLWPPIGLGAARVADGTGGFMLRLAGATGPAHLSGEEIGRQVSALSSLSSPGLFWNLMPEWDQSGGQWVSQGRPTYADLGREAAGARFLNYYQTSYPELLEHLRQPPPDARLYRLAAVTDHSPNVFYGYELGAELQMLERGIDELGDLSTGIAYLRGAATQFNKPWGIDISTWRSSTDGATTYDDAGHLISGWSASYLERMYYLAFAAGARVVHNEAVTYRYPNGTLNPFGEVTRQFAEFSLRRHPDIGRPTVNVAFLTDHFSGFDPKHGLHNQSNAVWYQDIPYSPGDYMTDNFMRVAYPGHWLHGLAPGAPFADRQGVPDPGAFARFLARGEDSRPFEPMPTTRWGDNIDVLTTRVAGESLDRYKVVVLVGDVTLDQALRDHLSAWVEQGGVLMVNAAQSTLADEDLLGARTISRIPKVATQSRWVAALEGQPEAAYSYVRVRTVSAQVLAVSGSGDPLITSHALGSGEVILTTPIYLQSSSRNQLLTIGVQLLDQIISRYEPVRVLGLPIEYVIGRPTGRVVVTLANHFGSVWDGQIVAPRRSSTTRVTEYISDQPAEVGGSDEELVIPVKVPPYGVRVIAIDES